MVLIMKQKMQNDLQDLCEFVLNSSSDSDFLIRFNFLLSVFIAQFEIEIKKKEFLPFFTHELINEYNSTFNFIIHKLNKETPNENLHLKDDIFMLIMKEDFNDHFNMWLCKGESSCN